MPLAAVEDRDSRVVSLIARHSLWREIPLARFPALNDPRLPLEGLTLTERDKTMVAAVTKIVEIAGLSY